jgi:hypothetical protein
MVLELGTLLPNGFSAFCPTSSNSTARLSTGFLGGPETDEPAVIGLAREVGALLAAEGIETEAELAAVIAAGVTAGQGYLLGRPSVHPLDWSPWVIQPTSGATVEP